MPEVKASNCNDVMHCPVGTRHAEAPPLHTLLHVAAGGPQWLMGEMPSCPEAALIQL